MASDFAPLFLSTDGYKTSEQCGDAVKVIASIDKSAGKTICTAKAVQRVRHKDVSNEHLLVLQKILNSPVGVELAYPHSLIAGEIPLMSKVMGVNCTRHEKPLA